nr:MAG TPA: hypothetical protein [Caudoviricetes sp.]
MSSPRWLVIEKSQLGTEKSQLNTQETQLMERKVNSY